MHGALFISAISMLVEVLDCFEVSFSDSGDVSFLFITVVVSIRKLDYSSVTHYHTDQIEAVCTTILFYG